MSNNIIIFTYSIFFLNFINNISKKYPTCDRIYIAKDTKELEKTEKEKNYDYEIPAYYSGEIVSEIFAYKDDIWCKHLKKIGSYLGRFLYILDAYEDIEHDLKKKSYNPFTNDFKSMSREEFEADKQPIFDILDEGFRKKKYSKINLVYNHYYSSSEVEFKNKVLFPLPEHLKSDRTYQEDFAYEGEIEPLLTNLIILYMQYELVIAGEVSSAALNITRQNTTTESLKKIDEREESRQMLERRQEREKEFGKVLDNYTKLNQY